MTIESVNPYTGQLLKRYDELTVEEIDGKLDLAEKAYREWRCLNFNDRALALRQVSRLLRKDQEVYARLIASEMGKPLCEGRSEIEKCAWVCEFYADNTATFLKSEEVIADAIWSRVAFQPLGVVLAVMPWNFPFWQVFRFVAPALMAGNVVVLKHASNVPGCAVAIEKIMLSAGFPRGIFQSLLISSPLVDYLLESPTVKAVTLTGSTPAGKAVAAKAGSELKKGVFELGGSDPYLILDDIDLTETVESCVASRLINGGQSCVSAKRFIVLEELKVAFESLMVEKMESYRMGDPCTAGVLLGPQARHDLRDQLHDQVCRSIDEGARLALGGFIPGLTGAFYPPTVLCDVAKGMPAYEEEMFGPVAAIICAHDEDDAIRIANDTPFGLGASVYTSDLAQAERVASKIEAGNCFINGFVRSDPRLPFGGIKQSGYGRELSAYGIREFVNIKTVCRVK